MEKSHDNVRSLAACMTDSQQRSQKRRYVSKSQSEWTKPWRPQAWLIKIFSLFADNYRFFSKSIEHEQSEKNLVTLWSKRLCKYSDEQIFDALDEVFERYLDNHPNPAQYERVIIERIARRKAELKPLQFSFPAPTLEQERADAIDSWKNLYRTALAVNNERVIQSAKAELEKLGVKL